MNCLTIDFDIIMKPAITLYNDLVGDNWTMNGIEKECPNLPLVLPPDYYIYEYLTRFIVKLFKTVPADKVFFIKSHEMAAKLLEGNTDVKLTNIDHHHDVGYEGIHSKTKLRFPHTGDWVKYCKDNGIVSSYLWIGNPNSIYPKDELEHYIDQSVELSQIDLLTFSEEVDMLIICNSPEWIPSMYQPLWDVWVGIAEEWYGVEFQLL